MFCGYCPIVEADSAVKCTLGVPICSRDPQPAGDAVGVVSFSQQGSGVSGHTTGDALPVDLPEHTDMVWVETSGHTN